jgi:hypothetical protein
MKHIRYILIVLLFLSSCEEFLEEYPQNSLVAEGFFNTPENIESGVLGCYNSLMNMYSSQSTHSHFVVRVNERSDNFWFGTHGANNENDLFEKVDIEDFWDNSYKTIRDVNIVLDALDEVDFTDESRKNQLKGELLYLRAICHFNLQNVYGDVPYITKRIINREEAMEFTRIPVSEILSSIEADLEEVVTLMVNHESNHRADKYSALALLVDVNMHQKDWTNAIEYAEEIINNGGFELVNIDDLFTIETNAGSIFEVQYHAGGDNTKSIWGECHDRFVADWGFLPEQTYGAMVPTWDLYRAYDENSPRFKAFLALAKSDDGIDSVAWSRKYEKQSGNDNLRVYRIAEIYLLYAEALNEQNNGPDLACYNAVNMVRRRAYNLPVDQNSAYDLPAGLSYDEFKTELFNEYRLELAGEAKWIFHLRRTGRFVEVITNHFSTTILPEFENVTVYEWMQYWPLPQDEINKNPDKLKQNPGWDQL